MSAREKAALDKKLREGIRAVLDNYPDGTYDHAELISDVRHDLDKLLARLGLSPKTPLKVYVEDGVLTVSLGTFLDRN